MTSIWVESLGRGFGEALDLLAAAVRDCTDELWESAHVGGPGRPVRPGAARPRRKADD